MFNITTEDQYQKETTHQVDADKVEILGNGLIALVKRTEAVFVVPTNRLVSVEKVASTGSISDGYHTFDELYDYRKAYNALVFNEWAKQGINQVVKSTKHSDGKECFDGGWFIVSAMTPHGQVSNHYEMKDWDLFQCEEVELGPVWDGHAPQDALERLLKTCKD